MKEAKGILALIVFSLLLSVAYAQEIPFLPSQQKETPTPGGGQRFQQGPGNTSQGSEQGPLLDVIVPGAGPGQPRTFTQAETADECPPNVRSTRVSELLEEIPSLNEKIKNCPIKLPDLVVRLVGDGNIQIDIEDKASVTAVLNNKKITEISLGPSEYSYLVKTDEASVNLLLNSDDALSTFQALYNNKKITIRGRGFVSNIKIFFLDFVYRIAIKIPIFSGFFGGETPATAPQYGTVLEDLEVSQEELAIRSVQDEGAVYVNRKEPCPPEYVKKLMEKKEDLEKQAEELDRKTLDLSREIRALERELGNLRKDRDERQEDLDEAKKILGEDAPLVKELEAKLETRNNEISEKETELESLTEELDLIYQQIDYLNNKIDEFNDIARHCGIGARKALDDAVNKFNRLPDDAKKEAENDFENTATDDEKAAKDGRLDDRVGGGRVMISTSNKLLGSMTRASKCPPPQERIVRVEDPEETIVVRGVENISITDARGKNFFPDSKKKEIVSGLTAGMDITSGLDDANTVIDAAQDLSAGASLYGAAAKAGVSWGYSAFQDAAIESIIKQLEEWEKERTLQGLPEWFEVSYGRVWEKEYTITSAYNKVYKCENGIWQYSHNTLALGDIEEKECRYSGGGTHEYTVDLQKLDLRGCRGVTSCPLAWERAMEDAMDDTIRGPLKGMLVGTCP